MSNSAAATHEIHLTRRRLDTVLIAFGALATAVFAVAGGLLKWGSDFAADYVRDELSSQHVTFPPAEALTEEGRDDLVKYAGAQVDTGKEAEAYASFINGHLAGVADGKTYSELDDRGAAAAVAEAKSKGASEEEIAALQATADKVAGQRNTLFKGETLRGLLLSAYAWSTVGNIAGYAAWAAFAAAIVMLVLTVLGFGHVRRLAKS